MLKIVQRFFFGRSLVPFLLIFTIFDVNAEGTNVSFSEKIAPILIAKCIACHGPEKAKGGFRAHTFEQFIRPGKSKSASIEPGKPEESEVFRRLTAKDEDDRMPQKDEPLSAQQIELFRQWILEGAKLDRGEATALLSTIVPKSPYPVPPEKYPRPVPILALAFNSAGTELFASGYHEVTVWNLEGRLLRRITNVVQRVHAIALHPSGNFVVVAGGQPGRGGEVAIYDAANGKLDTTLLNIGDEMLSLAFDSDGSQLAAGGSDNAIHLMDWMERKETHNIQQHADWVTALDFSPDGKRIASVSRDRTARIYSTVTGELETTYTGHSGPLMAVAFIDNDVVASAGREKEIHLWNADEGKKLREIRGFEGEILSLVSTKTNLFSASTDGLVREDSVADGKLIRKFKGQDESVFALALHRGSGKLAAGAYDGTVSIWNTADGKLERTFIAAPGFEGRQ
jgi:DNA-binding beta-propeller fold protein YncE